MAAAPLRVGLATVWDGVPDYACAVRHWCQHAQRLGDLLVERVPGVASAELLMMLTDDHEYTKQKHGCTCYFSKKRFCPECYGGAYGKVETISARDVVATDCPQIRLPPLEAPLRAAVQRFANAPDGGCRDRWQMTMLYKWWALSLQQYSLVILSDLDVQLLRPEQPMAHVAGRWRDTWATAVPPGGRTRVLAVHDYTSPFNGGLWTVGSPSRALYEAGLRVLERAVFNRTHGFNHVGTPRQIYKRYPSLRRRMHRTRMLKHNDWKFAFGDCDQGFLFYMFYLRRLADGSFVGASHEDVPAECSTWTKGSRIDDDPRCPHAARHYWGPRKPWQAEKDNLGRVAWYLRQTSFEGLPLANRSMCARRFASWDDRLRPHRLLIANRSKPTKWGGKLQRLR